MFLLNPSKYNLTKQIWRLDGTLLCFVLRVFIESVNNQMINNFLNVCESWIDQHDKSVWQKKILSLRQESNPWPPEHRAVALSTELRELMENQVSFNWVHMS